MQFGDYSRANAVAIQPDGKIVVAGTSERKLAIARYRRDGRLDPSFSSNGKLSTTFGRSIYGTSAVVLQPDGKVLVLCWEARRLILARFDPSGELDPAFSGDGWISPDLGSDVALDGDGRIILAGTRSRPGPAWDAAVARLQPDGDPDPSFSGDGVATATFAGYEYSYGAEAAVEPDGSPVLGGGSSDDQLAWDLALARFEPDGDLDPGFSDDGTTTVDISAVDYMRRIALRSDGRIVAGGAACPPYDELYGHCIGEVAQFDPDGSLDASFAEDGVRTLSLSRGRYVASATDVPAVTDDGGMVLAGSTLTDRQDYGPVDFALIRLDSTGSPDVSFRGGGMWTTDFLSGDDSADDVAIQENGKIVAVGSSDRQIALARYEVESGPPDADADGVRNPFDRCPVRFGDHADGCTRYSRSLTMHFNRDRDLYLGVIESREPNCVADQKVRVFRRRPGRDLEVDTTHTDSSGHWQIDARLHPGRYYAIAPKGYHRLSGICQRARAHGFRI